MTHSLLTLSDCRCDPSGSAHFLHSHCRCEIPDNVDFLLQPHTLSSYCRCSSSDTVHFSLKLHNLLFTLHNFLLVLHTFSLRMADVTFFTLQTSFSRHTPCFSTTNVPFFLPCFSTTDVPFICCTLSWFCKNLLLVLQMRPSWYWTQFSIGTTGVAFLIMKTFSSHHTPCHPAAAVTRDFLFGGKSIFKKMFEPRGGEKNFFRPSRGSGRCSPRKCWKYSVQDWLKSHFWTLVTFTDSLKSSSKRSLFEIAVNFFSVKLFGGKLLPCPQIDRTLVTHLILYTFPHTAQPSPCTAQPSPCTADATLLELNTFSICTANVTFLILQTFCSHHTPSPAITDTALLILYTF